MLHAAANLPMLLPLREYFRTPTASEALPDFSNTAAAAPTATATANLSIIASSCWFLSGMIRSIAEWLCRDRSQLSSG
jgi:hypothetical protein